MQQRCTKNWKGLALCFRKVVHTDDNVVKMACSKETLHVCTQHIIHMRMMLLFSQICIFVVYKTIMVFFIFFYFHPLSKANTAQFSLENKTIFCIVCMWDFSSTSGVLFCMVLFCIFHSQHHTAGPKRWTRAHKSSQLRETIFPCAKLVCSLLSPNKTHLLLTQLVWNV